MMPKIPYTKIKDRDLLPEESHFCFLKEIWENHSAAGNLVWNLIWCVVEGPYKGRYIFDHLVFIEKCYWKHKQLAKALGLDVSKDDILEQDMILNKSVIVKSYNDEFKGIINPKVLEYIREDDEEEEKRVTKEEDEEDDIAF